MGQWHEFICIRSVNGKAGGIETEGLCFTTKLPFICIPNNFRNYCCRWIRGALCHCPFPFYFCQVGCAELEREICFCGFYPSLMLAKFQHKLFDWPFSHLSKLSAGTFCHLVFSFTGLWHLTVHFLIWTNDSGDFLSPCCFLIYRSMTFDGPLSSLSKLHRGDCHFKENFLTRSIVILKRIFSLGRVTF